MRLTHAIRGRKHGFKLPAGTPLANGDDIPHAEPRMWMLLPASRPVLPPTCCDSFPEILGMCTWSDMVRVHAQGHPALMQQVQAS